MVDNLIAFSDYDQELKDGIAWLDRTEKYGQDIDFYEKVYRVLLKHDAEDKAKKWRESKP